jgi:DNA polymerase III subunit alpha
MYNVGEIGKICCRIKIDFFNFLELDTNITFELQYIDMFLSRCYSHYSLLSAIPQVNTLVEFAKNAGYTAIAVSDEDTGASIVDSLDACKKFDMKFCPSSTLRISNLTNVSSSGFNTFQKNFSKITLLPKNNKGLTQMNELISHARIVRDDPKPHLEFEDLVPYFEVEKTNMYLVITNDHEYARNLESDNIDELELILNKYIKVVGDENLAIELLYPTFNRDVKATKVLNQKLIKICKSKNLKYIVSCAPRHLGEDDSEVFRAVLAIRDGKRIGEIELDRDYSLASVDKMKEIYSYCPEALGTNWITDTINVDIRTDFDKHANEAFFPIFPLPEGQVPEEVLRRDSFLGLLTKFDPLQQGLQFWTDKFPYSEIPELIEFVSKFVPMVDSVKGYSSEYWLKTPFQKYIDRIDMELDVINSKGFPAYFLVVADIMRFCYENNIVTNTRGSAAGCLSGYLIGIGVLDPMVYEIPFERFLNPLRPSAPDIDGDFADDKRDLVIQYLTQKYGGDKVCQIITFGGMLPRAAVRDIGRVLGVSYTKCDKLSKIIPTAPQGRKTTFKWAMEASAEFSDAYEKDSEIRRIVDMAKKVEGNYRHASVHAAGLIISPTKLTDFMPLQWDADRKMIICQYDMKIAEKIGLVKMDILGISNLAILGNAVANAKTRHNIDIDLLNVNLVDTKTFDLLTKGRTMGLFQLSGPAMTKYLVQMQPNRVHDLMAMVALYRPGPMANIPDYIHRKNNHNLIKYYVPQMSQWMADSYGILVYQDDLLYTVINLAGYDWAEADTFRKGVGKKIQAVLDSQHSRFVEGCISHSGLERSKAEEIWELMVPFAAYGFNKAHASSYGMVAYWTAYMKANYPAEFMTSLMTSESNNLTKVGEAIHECKELGIDVLPPDVNKSFNGFTIEDDSTIRYGLASVKNLGSDVIKHIINSRQSGLYKNLEDFLDRMSEFQGFSKKSMEALVYSGALDGIEI